MKLLFKYVSRNILQISITDDLNDLYQITNILDFKHGDLETQT